MRQVHVTCRFHLAILAVSRTASISSNSRTAMGHSSWSSSASCAACTTLLPAGDKWAWRSAPSVLDVLDVLDVDVLDAQVNTAATRRAKSFANAMREPWSEASRWSCACSAAKNILEKALHPKPLRAIASRPSKGNSQLSATRALAAADDIIDIAVIRKSSVSLVALELSDPSDLSFSAELSEDATWEISANATASCKANSLGISKEVVCALGANRRNSCQVAPCSFKARMRRAMTNPPPASWLSRCDAFINFTSSSS